MRRNLLCLSILVGLPAVMFLIGCLPSAPASAARPAATPHNTTGKSAASGGVDATKNSASETKPRGESHQVDLATLSREQLFHQMIGARSEATLKSQAGQMDAAYAAYRNSGRIAEEIVGRTPKLTVAEKQIFGDVFYDQACGLAKSGDTSGATAALNRAIAAGWNNLEYLTVDTDLEAIQRLPDFATKLESWEQAVASQSAEITAAELARFESYPFNFELPDLDGNLVKFADHKGKVMIVNIWGTCYSPCLAEIPSFVKLQSKYADKGLQVIGLNYERAKTEKEGIKFIRDFQKEAGINYPCLIGDSQTKDQVPGFRSYPTTLFIDRTGKVRMQLVGPHPYSRLQSIVSALLAEPANVN